MSKYIVTTTIHPPTEAIERFDAMADWQLIVVGDQKTPSGYRLDRGIYLSPGEQERYDPELSGAIGWNCIQRRNLGVLLAYEYGAEIVALVDDDNLALPGWGADLLVGREVEVDHYETELLAFDPVGATNYPHLWHRGYPIQLVSQRSYDCPERRVMQADVQADFWNGDPDVDAVCRMEHAPDCTFDPAAFPLASNRPAPFNSQNTFLSRAVLADYFLFPGVGRMDDIWGAYYLQALGYRVVFGQPSVHQQRNPHDLTEDLRAEQLGYEHSLGLLEDLRRNPASMVAYLPGRSAWAWQLYRRHFEHV